MACMSESWRSILQQAGADLQYEAEQASLKPRHHGPDDGSSPWAKATQENLMERLDRELREASSRGQLGPDRQQAQTQQAQPQQAQPRPKRQTPPVKPQANFAYSTKSKAQTVNFRIPEKPPVRWGRNLAAVSVSVAVLGLTAYAFSRQWHPESATPQAAPQKAEDRASAIEARDLAEPRRAPMVEIKTAAFIPEAVLPVATPAAPVLEPAVMEQPAAPPMEPVKPAEEVEAKPAPADPAPTPQTASEEAAPVISPVAEPQPPRPAPLPALSAAAEESLLQRAAKFMSHGDIAAARLTYESLARRGSRRGALGAAETYDPGFLSSRFVQGLQPDIEKARFWYGRAVELGSAPAARRLIALNGAPN